MNTIVKRSLTAVVVLGVVGGGYAAASRNGKPKKDEVTYEFGKVARGDVRSFVTSTGVIQPWKIVDIKSNVDGKINRLAVDLGSVVKKDQVIMQIDPTNPQATYDQTQADLKSAEARKSQAEITVVQQRLQAHARLASARQRVTESEARLMQAEANNEVQPKLTAAAIEQARAALVSAEKAVLQATETRNQLQQQWETLDKVTIPLNIKVVQTNLDQAKANLLQSQREFTRQKELQGMGYVAQSEVDVAYARVSSMTANVNQAEQRLGTLKQENKFSMAELEARQRSSQSNIEENEARVRQAKASLDLAERNAVQIRVRQKDYDAAQAGLAQAKSELQVAIADLNQIAIRKGDILTAKAQIVRSEASFKQAGVNLGFTEIRAPRDGVVITKNVEEGTIVPSSRASIGSTNSLLQIGDISRLWIVCSVDETDIGQVSVNQKVTIKIEAYPSMLIEGKVIRIDPQAKIEQNVTNIPVTVEISEPDPKFKPGMNATCEFVVDEATGVLTVPNEALKESEGTYKVQKLVAGKVTDVEVEVGLAGLDVTEVRSGVKEDEEVITKIVRPEKSGTNNPFNPFGGMGGPRPRSGGPGGGGRPAGGGR